MPSKQQEIEIVASQPPKPTSSKSEVRLAATPTPSNSSQPLSTGKSWVWSHFNLKIVKGNAKVECNVAHKKKGGEPCGQLLVRDPTGSTKSMSEHLKRIHLILPPGQAKNDQALLPALLNRQRLEKLVGILNQNDY
jgi:hypothetical protein